MNVLPERRKSPRNPHPDLPIAVICPTPASRWKVAGRGRARNPLFVNIVDSSGGGLLLSSFFPLKKGAALDLFTSLPGRDGWKRVTCRVVSARSKEEMPEQSLIGIRYETFRSQGAKRSDSFGSPRRRMSPRDLDFLLGTPLLDSITQEARCLLLSCLTQRTIRAGKRLMAQGEEGNSLFIIRRGSCLVSIERDEILHPVARLQAGEIVGEMAILTGEPRFAHVDAETDMDLWGLTRKEFDPLCARHKELRDFLTRLITRRFSTEGLTASRTVGKYLIQDILGKGGWSFVYRGTHAHLNMPVAVKMLKHDLAMKPDFLERFRAEAKIIARLNHQNIVKVYDIEELFRTIFVVMEYLDGVPLSHMLKQMVRLPLPNALGILLDVCAGLSYAHGQGIVHQDIKPANLFVQPDKRVKIMDFGLAGSPGTAHPSLKGTFGYMSPEQIRGEGVDERTDIYSLGVTVFEMITGLRPFSRDGIAETLSAQLTEDMPDPSQWVTDLPVEVRSFLFRSTRKAREDRFGSVAEIQSALQPLAEKMGIQAGARPPEQRKMMSLFLFYHEEHQLTLKRLVEAFGGELKRIGALLKAADFKDL